ncbi:toprim domain-containing protein [Lederbergia lenta]|uniref:Nucleic acid binding protein YusF n=1 Tax=Lederbergia lenta TaxID=1467 RepID=A0A2X4WPJ9_LEDLE|nr:toprim domain-containing protein [Lederbergia lenta]MCM3112970.1 toprim domain-containing protein [Lederbergia lenta]MEC2326640.1 toprim domain-containing protein [Lederbergia lenta]SQI61628.1 nucleic acid binding protein YusF [Lederbergia lenta]
MDTAPNKVIIVEGLSDKKRVARIINEPIDIICTNGTISLTKLDELVEELEDRDVYILVDADISGDKLRKQLKREFPMAYHLYIDRTYREVATTPYQHLATMLLRANIDVDVKYL